MKNKKGSFGDLFYLMIIVVVCAFVFTMGWVIFNKVDDNLQEHDQFSTVGKDIMTSSKNRYVTIFDNLFLVVMVVVYLGALILAYQIDANPVFFIAAIIIFGVLVMLTAVFGNTFYSYATNAAVSTYVDDFTIIPFVMNNFVATFVVLAFGLAGVMYAKAR